MRSYLMFERHAFTPLTGTGERDEGISKVLHVLL